MWSFPSSRLNGGWRIRPTREIHTGGDPHPILKRKYRWNRVEERRRALLCFRPGMCLCRKPIRSAGVDLGADDAHDLLLDLGLLCVNISVSHLTVLVPETHETSRYRIIFPPKIMMIAKLFLLSFLCTFPPYRYL